MRTELISYNLFYVILKLGNICLFNCLLIYLLIVFVLFVCFIYFAVTGQRSFATVEKGLWNNLPIVLKKSNETYSVEMTNVFLKEAKLPNDLSMKISSCLLFVIIQPVDKITNDMLQSVIYIHSKNIVHRDI